ncbi:hypothetical protein CC85DRAFT_85207 [Cutaneotrichosporon oleaginosum]|uniref:Uncharacterized protein n=1 Tax=Cutaneotrichosporon oleaginosum TaxID=879819 RepID=A0A0J0XMZ4_9TREE|nr:uncharacterized protein CC85DRAFT_85207 [Cutaneotrichosporon oleaginosum]KLT42443.1 hypothetical protein CC85DRAFT_85207 [Cutaneotrichosporon oleaginosum]TXT06962.1 hypothetical protein COLE_06293 [Cutaneotrichosporon oleaginosum]
MTRERDAQDERERRPALLKSASTTTPTPLAIPNPTHLVNHVSTTSSSSSSSSSSPFSTHTSITSSLRPSHSRTRSRTIDIVRTDLIPLVCLALCARSSTSHLALASILLASLAIILHRPFHTRPRPSPPSLIIPTMPFVTPKASPSPMSDRSVSGAPELVGSFVEKYKDLKARYEEAQAKADKYERLYTELKVRADELAELEASLPTVARLEAELEHEARLRRKVTEELDQLKREQEELLAMQ